MRRMVVVSEAQFQGRLNGAPLQDNLPLFNGSNELSHEKGCLKNMTMTRYILEICRWKANERATASTKRLMMKLSLECTELPVLTWAKGM
jgi:hypothetical protein